MEDIIRTKEKIEALINSLQGAKKELKARGEKKAETIANYDKVLALTILKMKNGIIKEFEGANITDPPATILEKLAKGYCWQERLELEKADAAYKSLITYIDVTEAQLNGYQSINRHLE